VRVYSLEVRENHQKQRAAEISVALIFFVLMGEREWRSLTIGKISRYIDAILIAYPFGHVGRYEFATTVDGNIEVLLDGRYHVLEPATEGAIAHSRCTS
jgi:hypothetical protein